MYIELISIHEHAYIATRVHDGYIATYKKLRGYNLATRTFNKILEVLKLFYIPTYIRSYILQTEKLATFILLYK